MDKLLGCELSGRVSSSNLRKKKLLEGFQGYVQREKEEAEKKQQEEAARKEEKTRQQELRLVIRKDRRRKGEADAAAKAREAEFRRRNVEELEMQRREEQRRQKRQEAEEAAQRQVGKQLNAAKVKQSSLKCTCHEGVMHAEKCRLHDAGGRLQWPGADLGLSSG